MKTYYSADYNAYFTIQDAFNIWINDSYLKENYDSFMQFFEHCIDPYENVLELN